MFKIKSRKKLIIVILAVFLVAGGVGYAAYKKSDDKVQTAAKEGVNLDPPTKEDSERADKNKQAIVEKDEAEKSAPSTVTTGKKAVTPTITYADQYAGQVEVGAFISGIFEDGGTCTATFKLGSTSFTKDVQAVKGANSVNCPVMAASVDSFKPRGSWQVSVSYTSATASGTSEAKQIEVQ